MTDLGRRFDDDMTVPRPDEDDLATDTAAHFGEEEADDVAGRKGSVGAASAKDTALAEGKLNGAVAAMLGLLLAACTYHGDTGNPIARNLTWFSYLNGDDIRNQCQPGGLDRYRFAYNGVYTEQVRTYDVTGGADPVMRVHVLGERGQIGSITVDSPSSAFDPWTGQTETVHLRQSDLATLKSAMQAGGVFQPLQRHLQLSSDDFYWIVAACTDGRFAFNAYRWPSERFDRANFPRLLFAWDPSGIPVNPPRQVDPYKVHRAGSPSDLRNAQRFDIGADAEGLIGVGRLF